METIALTLKTLPTEEQRLIYLENRVAEQPDDLMAWLYLADSYLYIDLDKTIHAWQQIAKLRPADDRVQYAMSLIAQMNGAAYQ